MSDEPTHFVHLLVNRTWPYAFGRPYLPAEFTIQRQLDDEPKEELDQ